MTLAEGGMPTVIFGPLRVFALSLSLSLFTRIQSCWVPSLFSSSTLRLFNPSPPPLLLLSFPPSLPQPLCDHVNNQVREQQ